MKDLLGRLTWFYAVLALVLSGAWVTPSHAQQQKPTVDVSVSFMSQYVWRGEAHSRDSLVIQPSYTFGYKGAFVNIWQNIDTNPWESGMDNLNETDFTFGYNKNLGPVTVEGGYIWYALSGAYDSHELYVSGTLNTILNPKLTIYREIGHYPGTYITLGVSQDVPIGSYVGMGNMDLHLGAKISYLASNDKGAYPDGNNANKDFNDFKDGLIYASLTFPIANGVTLSPEIDCSFPLSKKAGELLSLPQFDAGRSGQNTFIYGGVTLDVSF